MSEMCFDDFDYNRKTCDKCGFDYDDREGCDCESTDNKNCQVDLRVSLNFADIKEIYERNDIPMDADAIGLQPLYYSRDQLTKFIEELNFYFEKVSKISS